MSQFQPSEAHILSNISSFMSRNPMASGLLLDQGWNSLSSLFVPILCPTDVQILPYVLFRFAEKEPVELMIWDAIGILASDTKAQKFYQLIGKKIEGKVMLWDGNQKIDRAFIQGQDLVIMGSSGWAKLLNAVYRGLMRSHPCSSSGQYTLSSMTNPTSIEKRVETIRGHLHNKELKRPLTNSIN